MDAFLAAARGGYFDALLDLLAADVVLRADAGLVNTVDGEAISVMSFTVAGGRIAAIDILSDPDRLPGLDLIALDGPPSRETW